MCVCAWLVAGVVEGSAAWWRVRHPQDAILTQFTLVINRAEGRRSVVLTPHS